MTLMTKGHGRRQGGRAALILVALIVLALIGAGLWFALRGKIGAERPVTEVAAHMAPQNTQVLLAMDVGRTGMPKETETKILEALLQTKAFQEVNKEIQDELGLTLEKDFLSWMEPAGALILAPKEGQLGLAQAVAAAKSDDELPPFHLLLVLKVRDPKQAEAALQQVQDKAAKDGTNYKTETVEGVTVQVPEKPGEGPAWALNQGFLLVGITAEDLQMGLASKGPSLADSERFKAAVSSLKRTDGLLAYVDLQGIMEGAPLAGLGAPDAEKLLSSLRYVVVGSGVEGKQAISEWRLVIDPAQAGPLAGEIFNPKHNIEFQSAKYCPADIDAFLAVNLRALYDVVYAALGSHPRGAMAREMPSAWLAQKGLNFKQDILGTLTGEMAYAARDMGKIQAAQLRNLAEGGRQPGATMAALQEVPFLVALGITGRQALEGVFDKAKVSPMLKQMPSTDVDGTAVRGDDRFAFAITKDAALLSVNGGKATLEASLQLKGKGLNEDPGLARVLGLLGAEGKAVLVGYQDTAKLYAQAAAEMKDQEQMAEVMTLLSLTYGKSWSGFAVRQDGMYGVGVVELNPKPVK